MVLLRRLSCFAALFLFSCGGGSTSDPCAHRICTTGDAATSDGATPQDSGGSDGSVQDASGPCVESWLCTPWSTNGSGSAGTRVCTDQHACGTTTSKPIESATLPALDSNFYMCNVEPILDGSCAMVGCHGTETGRALRVYARGRLRITGDNSWPVGPTGLCKAMPSEMCTASTDCGCAHIPHTAAEWRRNYDAARGLALQSNGQPYPAGQQSSSELVQQPLIGSGYSHDGIHMFGPGSNEYATLVQWLSGATLASCTTNN